MIYILNVLINCCLLYKLMYILVVVMFIKYFEYNFINNWIIYINILVVVVNIMYLYIFSNIF